MVLIGAIFYSLEINIMRRIQLALLAVFTFMLPGSIVSAADEFSPYVDGDGNISFP